MLSPAGALNGDKVFGRTRHEDEQSVKAKCDLLSFSVEALMSNNKTKTAYDHCVKVCSRATQAGTFPQRSSATAGADGARVSALHSSSSLTPTCSQVLSGRLVKIAEDSYAKLAKQERTSSWTVHLRFPPSK